jgi:asparagine synthase (glutamine-hydrolysing)
MCAAMAHRGPDGQGVWLSADARVGLGHRRLAIVDLSASASQPMADPSGRFMLSFNGEIYNHAQLRTELDAIRPRQWKTDHSDTEVILHAFAQWGIDCLSRFRGVFALALWDSTEGQLWLARDRLGEKPLYYARQPGRIVFASEIKGILADPALPRSVNPTALYHYLSFLAAPAPDTLFEGVAKLPAGHWMRIDREGRQQIHCYWDVWDHVRPGQVRSEAEACEAIRALLEESVELRKVSDVPVGVFLSGGIDSSTNAALFSRGRTSALQTFSIGYQGNFGTNPSELPYARLVADSIGAQHHERVLGEQDLLDFLEPMVRFQDEPLADPVCFPVHFVSRLARDHGMVVCHVGEGADELFCGYAHWKTMLDLQRWNEWPVPRAVKHLGLAASRTLGAGTGLRHEWLRRGAAGLPVFWGGAEAITEGLKQELLEPGFRESIPVGSSWEALAPIRARFEAAAWEPSALNWMTYVDLRQRLPELLLMRVDKMSMATGLEARVPFLDHRLVELVMGLPTAMKLGDGTLKHLLKKAVRGLIPDAVIDRRKQGFGVPVTEWLAGELGRRVRRELEAFCVETRYFDRRAVARLFDAGRTTEVWCLFNLALWWRVHIAR